MLCLHSRGDENVPYSYSERYVAAAAAAGGQAGLAETSGDHFTLIDPGVRGLGGGGRPRYRNCCR